MSFDPISYAMGKQAGGGGGGNPNRVETVTGTLANPFGDLDFEGLAAGLTQNSVTIYLTAMGSTMYGQKQGSTILFGTVLFAAAVDQTPYIGGSVTYAYNSQTGVAIDYAKVLPPGGQTWLDLPTTTPTVLTVIHHPLPEEG